MRSRTVAAATSLMIAPLALLAPESALAAPASSVAAPDVAAGWRVIAQDCTGSGDQCFSIQRDGNAVRFEARTAARYYGRIKICVRKENSLSRSAAALG